MSTGSVAYFVPSATKHKLGSDGVEAFPAVPVNPDNRLEDVGDVREIDVS